LGVDGSRTLEAVGELPVSIDNQPHEAGGVDGEVVTAPGLRVLRRITALF
jgi:hypothetical protein